MVTSARASDQTHTDFLGKLADAIIATTKSEISLLPSQSQLAAEEELSVVFTLVSEECAPVFPRYEGSFLRVGPYEVRPALGYEVPLGRGYQPMLSTSISRLAGYLGRDEHSMYIREVPDAPDHGMRPSKNGIWVKQPYDAEFRRLQPGEAERISLDTDIRLGGNGEHGDAGFRIHVH